MENLLAVLIVLLLISCCGTINAVKDNIDYLRVIRKQEIIIREYEKTLIELEEGN